MSSSTAVQSPAASTFGKVPALGKGKIHPGVVWPGDTPPVITGDRLVWLAQTGQYLAGLAKFDQERVSERGITKAQLTKAARYLAQWADHPSTEGLRKRGAAHAASVRMWDLADLKGKKDPRPKAPVEELDLSALDADVPAAA